MGLQTVLEGSQGLSNYSSGIALRQHILLQVLYESFHQMMTLVLVVLRSISHTYTQGS